MCEYTKIVFEFEKCLGFQKNFQVLYFCEILPKCSRFEKLFAFFELLSFYKFCSQFLKVFAVSYNLHVFFSKIAFLKNVWSFSKLFSVSKYVLKKQKMFALYKIVHASKFVQDFSKLFFVSKFVLKVQKMFGNWKKIFQLSKFVHKFNNSSCFSILFTNLKSTCVFKKCKVISKNVRLFNYFLRMSKCE